MANDPDDQELIKRIEEGDEIAIRIFQERHRDVIRRACKHVFVVKGKGFASQLSFHYEDLIPDIESIVWDSLLRAVIEGKSKLANAPEKIIFAAARNHATTLVRSSIQQRKSKPSEDKLDIRFPRFDDVLEAEPENFVLDDDPELAIIAENIYLQFMEALTERERKILEMEQGDVPRLETARRLGISEKTVYNDVQAAKEKLQKLLQENGG